MRNISFSLTKEQILAGAKTVTRRNGWRHAQPGQLLQGAEKCQGLKRGEKIKRLRVVRLLDVRFEPLRRMLDDPEYGREECRLEGFPDKTPEEFVQMYCKANSCTADQEITRLQFEYVNE